MTLSTICAAHVTLTASQITCTKAYLNYFSPCRIAAPTNHVFLRKLLTPSAHRTDEYELFSTLGVNSPQSLLKLGASLVLPFLRCFILAGQNKAFASTTQVLFQDNDARLVGLSLTGLTAAIWV